jgi:hypothetical protein
MLWYLLDITALNAPEITGDHSVKYFAIHWREMLEYPPVGDPHAKAKMFVKTGTIRMNHIKE